MSTSGDKSTLFANFTNVFGSSSSTSNTTTKATISNSATTKAPTLTNTTKINSSSNTTSTVPNIATNASPSSSTSGKYQEGEKVKTHLLSMWNNMKYGMKLKTNFSKESPVWLLGKCYHRKVEDPEEAELGTDIAAFTSQPNIAHQHVNEEEGLEGFKQDFITRIWLTYRREFPVLNGSTYSSDCGWGCMLRSGQMLLAQALVCHFLGRNWRWSPETIMTNSQGFIQEINHRRILKWFGDKPSINSPLSIHSLVNLGESSGKKPGDWYGPGNVAHILKQAVKLASNDNAEFDAITVYVAQDCAVYIKDVIELCEMKDGRWKSLVLLIPVRLGAEKLNHIYGPCLTALFTLEQCIGIIGGRPRHSLYFIGYQDDKLIHLDPHYCQEMVDVWSADFPLNSFHCKSPRKMHVSKMDPSCCIGFYCREKEDFFNLMEVCKTIIIPPNCSSDYPMFVFCDGYSKDARTEFVYKHRIPHDVPSYYDYDRGESSGSSGGDFMETEEFEVV